MVKGEPIETQRGREPLGVPREWLFQLKMTFNGPLARRSKFMRLSTKALAFSLGLIWGGCLLLVGILNLVAPAYGADFLKVMGSVYPGFYVSHTFVDVILGGVYGFIDGAIGGWIFGWLYNQFCAPTQQSGTIRMDRAA
jgi:hypothetical protein